MKKQAKFLNFILHLSERAAMRRWKEQTFGVGADPRVALALMEERDRIRAATYEPIIEHRKSLRAAKFALRERNQQIAKTMRENLSNFRQKFYHTASGTARH